MYDMKIVFNVFFFRYKFHYIILIQKKIFFKKINRLSFYFLKKICNISDIFEFILLISCFDLR